MVFICTPDLPGSCGRSYTSGPWASSDMFGTPVPLKVRRYRLDPGAMVHTDGEANRLEAGMSALVGPGEVHWFRNDTDENFSFVEFWAPPPTGTLWTVAGDRCTWAPAAPGA
jgi:hypothetical protein